jgi:DNA repair exonuclease SbcCD ATPase subunit
MANVGDLYVNFKVSTDGLQAGLSGLNNFVTGSKRDLNAMNGAVDALSSTLAKLGVDPSVIGRLREFVSIGTKGFPKMVEGIAALQRQINQTDIKQVTVEPPKLQDLESIQVQIAAAKNAVASMEENYAQLASGAQAAIDSDKRVIRSKAELSKVTERLGLGAQAIIDSDAKVIRSRAALEKATQRVAAIKEKLASAEVTDPAVRDRSLDQAQERRQKAADRLVTAQAKALESVKKQEAAAERLAAAQAKARSKFDAGLAPETAKLSAARERLATITDSLAEAEQRNAAATTAIEQAKRLESLTAEAAANASKQGGAVTAAIRSVGQLASSIPDRLLFAGASLAESMQLGVSKSRAALASLFDTVRQLPSRIGGASAGIAAAFTAIPATFGRGVEAIKTGAMAMDRTLTGLAVTAFQAGKSIGAAIYAAIGPIGLALAAAAALYALWDKLRSDAEKAEAATAARIDANRQRSQSVFEAGIERIKNLQQEAAQAQEGNAYLETDIARLQELIEAQDGQRESLKQQIDKERELRDELKQNKDAQVELALIVERREEAERRLLTARDKLSQAQGRVAGGSGTDAEVDVEAAAVKDRAMLVDLARAEEAAARKVVEQTASLVNNEAMRIDKAAELKRIEDEAAKARKAQEALTSILQGYDDERVRATMTAADYEEMILRRKLEQAGITDPTDVNKAIAAKAARDITEQTARFEKEQQANAEALLQLGMDREQAERRVYELKVLEMNLAPAQTAELLSQYDAIKSIQEAKEAQESIASEVASIERSMLEVTLGKDAAERAIYETKLRAAGLDGEALAMRLQELDALQAQRKQLEDSRKLEQEMNRLKEDRARLEEQLAEDRQRAIERAAEMEAERQSMTENLSTAIGGITIAAASTQVVDVQKVIADETKKTVEELRKVNEKLAKGNLVLT